jgi:hypothetical protein
MEADVELDVLHNSGVVQNPCNMSTVKVVRYETGRKLEWDEFVKRSKNGIFLYHRDYLEYHADRFLDSSLMFYDADGRLVALLPASANADGVISSHAGLTFGGIVSDETMKVALMLEVFEVMLAQLRGDGLRRLVYKALPHTYHRLPAEEDLYALFRFGARIFRRDVSSTLEISERPPLSKGRKWSIKQALKHGLNVLKSSDFETFMAIEERLLDDKYGARPVHSAAEIGMLGQRFPENIKLFAAHDGGGQMLAGVIIYQSQRVAHAQYIGVSEEGKKVGALDLIVSHLTNHYYADHTAIKYFDFGISTENDGRKLNAGLIENKQSYGARAIVHDFYELDLERI